MPQIRIERVYDPPSPDDGLRILVDRLWPRGLSKDRLRLDAWLKELAPSSELRRRFGHDPARWAEFQAEYRLELAGKRDLWAPLLAHARAGGLTLVDAARDPERNNAVVLQGFLQERLAEEAGY